MAGVHKEYIDKIEASNVRGYIWGNAFRDGGNRRAEAANSIHLPNLFKIKTMWSLEEQKQREIASAKTELTKMEAVKVLLTNNDLGAEMNVAGIVVCVSVNERLLPVVEAEMEEIKKYLAGEPNNYE